MADKIVTKAHVAEYAKGWSWNLDLFQDGKKIVVKGWAVPIDPSPSPNRYRWAGHKPLFQKEMVWTLKALGLTKAQFTFDYEGESYSFVENVSTLKTPPDDVVAALCGGLSVVYDGKDATLIPMDIAGMWNDD